MTMLPPLTWGRAFTSWTFSPAGLAVLAAAGAGYLAVLARLLRRGGQWPLRRAVAFLLGLAVVGVAMQSSIGTYSMTLYWVHMVQHLALIMLAPMLLATGHPLRLLRDCSGRRRPVVDAVLRSRVVSIATMPGLTLGLYTVVLVGTHLTAFMRAMGAHPWLQPVESAGYVASGYLFVLTLLADEPIRWHPGYLVRLVLSLLGMGADTGVGVVLMMPVDPQALSGMHARAWGPSPLADLHVGGAVMWVFGDGLMLVITLLLAARWLRDTDRRGDLAGWLDAVRRDRLTGHAADDGVDVDTDDAALDGYNAMLASLDSTRPEEER